MNELELSYRGTAVVTGASKGIGRAIALAYAKLGLHIAIFDVIEDAGEKVVKEIEENGGKAIYVQVDVSSEDEVIKGANIAKGALGVPSILVNNAGIFPRKHALEMSYNEWQKVINVNLGGAFLCSRTFAPDMLKNGGVILNIASRAGIHGEARGTHYAASKAGIISLTRSLALEWAPHIRVNTIIPGLTDTDQPRCDTITEEELYARGKRNPLGRMCKPEDIAKAACLFVDQNASFITGQSLCVNGGAIMQ